MNFESLKHLWHHWDRHSRPNTLFLKNAFNNILGPSEQPPFHLTHEIRIIISVSAMHGNKRGWLPIIVTNVAAPESTFCHHLVQQTPSPEQPNSACVLNKTLCSKFHAEIFPPQTIVLVSAACL
ncbi:hypothetical protein CDAR_520931 [Caerostris darwini]|uniref:Uncharacterized protein n=1 Tax=Caerostris darwini TaxID=1538125 RepID=A0AAV4NIQ2_9ARAC|nr:hypothetical protein CDAR_520931 [Caerostris darwini]